MTVRLEGPFLADELGEGFLPSGHCGEFGGFEFFLRERAPFGTFGRALEGFRGARGDVDCGVAG